MTLKYVTGFGLLLALLIFQPVSAAANQEGAIGSCLNSWGEHPFGRHPRYKVLTSSVKVFGIGQNMDDLTPTKTPQLVLVDTGVNVMGGSTMQLLNPNGWYCFLSNVNVMGGLTIKTHCKAHLATAFQGVTVLGGDPSNQSVTVLGATNVETVGCPKP